MSDQAPDQTPGHSHEPGCGHTITLERIGDTLIVDIPANDTHYELTFSVAAAIRVGSAMVRVASGENDSLSNEQIEAALTYIEDETKPDEKGDRP